MTLADLHCEPCKDGSGKLSEDEVRALLDTLQGWKLSDDGITIYLRLTFPNFKTALAFVTRVGEVAEAENHHPDIRFGWGYAECHLTTHSAGGLTKNDFILAARIDVLASGPVEYGNHVVDAPDTRAYAANQPFKPRERYAEAACG